MPPSLEQVTKLREALCTDSDVFSLPHLGYVIHRYSKRNYKSVVILVLDSTLKSLSATFTDHAYILLLISTVWVFIRSLDVLIY